MANEDNCLVTGASRGIGRAIALELARKGKNVAVNFRSHEDEAEEVVGEIRSLGCRSLKVRADVSDDASVRGMVKQVVSELGSIDVLINNAGTTRDVPVIGMESDDWEKVISVNLSGMFYTARSAANYMVRNRRGSIVNVSSILAGFGGRGAANYAASKGGVESFTRALAIELGGKGVRVNAVAPGVIDTHMTDRIRAEAGEALVSRIPLGRVGSPDDVAKLVTFLCSEEAAYITGQVIHIDGGFGLC